MSYKPKINEKVHYVASTTFTLDKCYSDLKPIGKGSYGVVCSAFSSMVDKKVAIKKITPMAKQVTDAKHVLREMKLMRHMGKHENIVTLIDLAVRESHDELYIIMELLDSDLHRILQSKQELSENHYRNFFHQLLSGVKYLHDNRIIHRDLKPGNLLVTKDCKLRITDFGLARERPIGKGDHGDEAIDEPMTEHVVTRWYRPPELMLCPDGLYDYAVDIWSCGCILAEMLGRNPLFPGKNFVHQLSLVFDVIGSPVEADVRHIVNHEAKKFLASQSGKSRVPFRKIYPNSCLDAWTLLDHLLVFNPEQRLTVDEALRAPYLVGVGLPASAEYPLISEDFEFSFEYNTSVTRYQLKQMISAEVLSFKREQQALRRGEGEVETAAHTRAAPPATAAQKNHQSSAHHQQEVESKAKEGHKLSRNSSSASINNRSSSAPRIRSNASTGHLHRGEDTNSTNAPAKGPLPAKKPSSSAVKPPVVLHPTHVAASKHDDSSTVHGMDTRRATHFTASAASHVSKATQPPMVPLTDPYGLPLKPKQIPTGPFAVKEYGITGQMSIPEMIQKITAATAVDEFSSVSLQNYGSPGPKSPAKSLRYSTSLSGQPGNGRSDFDEPEYDMVRSDEIRSASHQSSSPAKVKPPGSPERRSIMETYLSPQRIVNRHSVDREGESSLRAASASTPEAPAHRSQSAAGRHSGQGLYNSMVGLFNHSEPRNEVGVESVRSSQRGSSLLHSSPQRPASHGLVGRTVSSDEDREEEEEENSTDSSNAGTLERVHIYSEKPLKAHPHSLSEQRPSVQHTHGNFGESRHTVQHNQSHRTAEYSAKAEAEEDAKYTSYLRGVALQQQYPVVSHHKEDNGHKASNAAHIEQTHQSAAHTAAAVHGGEGPAGAKKKITVAKSPKFSTMSWQRGRDAPPHLPPHPTTAALGGDKRSTSNLRAQHPLRADEDGKPAAAPKPPHIPSYMSATGSYLNKTNTRSESAPRGGGRR